MNRLKERLERSATLMDIIDRSREETGNPNLAADIERILIDGVIKDLEEEARLSAAVSEPVFVRTRTRRATEINLTTGPPLSPRARLMSRCYIRLLPDRQKNREDHDPTASATHFFMWLALAAPASFLSAESFWQAVVASRSHFCMKLLSAAPASFLSAASDLQVANAGAEIKQVASAGMICFMGTSLSPGPHHFFRCPECPLHQPQSKNTTFVPLLTMEASFVASQFVSRMQPCDTVLLTFEGSGVPWMP